MFSESFKIFFTTLLKIQQLVLVVTHAEDSLFRDPGSTLTVYLEDFV